MSSSPNGPYNASKDDRHRHRGMSNGSLGGEVANWESNGDWWQR